MIENLLENAPFTRRRASSIEPSVRAADRIVLNLGKLGMIKAAVLRNTECLTFRPTRFSCGPNDEGHRPRRVEEAVDR